jgi:hypothetical protein
MGYLPIILALLGFLFLWTIVNYQSIRIRKNEVTQAIDEIFKKAATRNQALKDLSAQVTEEDAALEIIEFFRRKLDEQTDKKLSLAEKLEYEMHFDKLMDDIPPPSGHTAYEEAYQQLVKVHNQYRQTVANYRKRVREYNELISKNPSRLVAGLTGFSPIQKI